jgi:drug/metabolite transporter superfamily protein YnfA
MAITEYDGLKAEIQAWCARSDSMMAGRIPAFVGLCEDRIYHGSGAREEDPLYSAPLRSSVMEHTVAVTLTDGTAPLPADFLDIRRLARDNDQAGLTILPPSRFAVEAEKLQGAGYPVYMTIEGQTLKVAPVFTGDLSLLYYRRFPAITDGNKAGPLLSAYGNIYFAGCLYEAFTWLQDTELAMGHLARFRSAVAGANSADSRHRYRGVPMRVMPRRPIP